MNIRERKRKGQTEKEAKGNKKGSELKGERERERRFCVSGNFLLENLVEPKKPMKKGENEER